MEKIIERLVKFFDDELRRGQIGNDLYLTNSKMLVRLPGCAELFNEVRRPLTKEQIDRVWRYAKESEKSVLVEKVCALSPSPVPCSTCEGRGFVYLCKDCDGTGECFCMACDRPYDCKICDGTGIRKTETDKTDSCDSCSGTGTAFQAADVFGKKVNLSFLRLIAEIAPGAIIFKPNDESALYFKGDKIDGLVMPVF